MWLLLFKSFVLLLIDCTEALEQGNAPQSDLDKCLEKVIQHAHSELIFYFEDDTAAESFCSEVNITVTCAQNYSFSIFHQKQDKAYEYAAQRMAQIYLDDTRQMRNLIYRDHNLREGLKHVSCEVSFVDGVGYNCDFYKDRLKSVLKYLNSQSDIFSFSAHDLVLRCAYSVVQKQCGKIATDFWAQTMNNYVITSIKEQCYPLVEASILQAHVNSSNVLLIFSAVFIGSFYLSYLF